MTGSAHTPDEIRDAMERGRKHGRKVMAGEMPAIYPKSFTELDDSLQHWFSKGAVEEMEKQ